MFPLLFLVVDSRIVDRYFSFSLGVDMSLSLVSCFSRQAAAKEKKEKCNRSKLSKALHRFVCLYQRTTKEKERKEKKKIPLLLLLLLLLVAHRIMVVVAGDVYLSLSSSCHYSCYSKVKCMEKRKQANRQKVIRLIFLSITSEFLVFKHEFRIADALFD